MEFLFRLETGFISAGESHVLSAEHQYIMTSPSYPQEYDSNMNVVSNIRVDYVSRYLHLRTISVLNHYLIQMNNVKQRRT